MSLRPFTVVRPFMVACLLVGLAGALADSAALAQSPASRARGGAKPKPGDAKPDETAPADDAPAGEKPAERVPLTTAEKNLLNAIRAGLAQRDLPAALKALDKAKEHMGSDSYETDLERLSLLYEYVTQFWKAADTGLRTLKALDEIEIGDQRASVVEVTPDGVLIIRANGGNKQRTLKDMPPKLAVTLALRALDENDPVVRVVIGAFWAMDAQAPQTPDPEAARRLWNEASKSGVDVSDLLPELGAEGAKVTALPKLTPADRQMLSPGNWLLRVGAGDRVKRSPAGKAASQNTDGRLDIDLSSASDGGQVVAEKRLAGDFQCRAILTNVTEGQTFGLFSAGGRDGSWVVTLPAGTVEIAFNRKGDKYTATVNGEEVEPASPDGAAARMAGQIGVSVPSGGACTIAAFGLR